MKKKKTTSIDIAKAAGVSQATVSMVLNKKYNVSFSKDTIERVERAAKELGYTIPKGRKKSRSRENKLIAAFCPTITNPYYASILQGIEEAAKENGYQVFVCNTLRDLKVEENHLKLMRTMRPQGIIYTCTPSFEKEVESIAKEIPVVIIGNKSDGMAIDMVELNNKKPGRLMARHLLELGHRKVAFIAPPLTERQPARRKRVDGFREEFEKAGLLDGLIVKTAEDTLDLQVPTTDSEFQMGYSLTKELLAERRDFTAVAGLNDMIALGVLEALAEAKYKVPNDVSVLGCDNILFSRMHNVGLTTIEHYVPLKGRDACEIIVKKIASSKSYTVGNSPTSIYHIEYEPKLIPRKTTSYVRKEKNK